MKERAEEAMLAGSRVFKDDDLQARALELVPMMLKTEKKDKKDENADKQKEDEDEKDKSVKGKGGKKEAKWFDRDVKIS